MQKELFSLFGNGRRNNKRFTLSAGQSVTCHFRASGADSATDKYFDLRQGAHKVAITLNKAASITHIGSELDFPMTIPTGGRTFSEGIEWEKFTVRADQDATTFEICAS